MKMLGNISASLGMTVRVAELQEAGTCTDAQAALARVVLHDPAARERRLRPRDPRRQRHPSRLHRRAQGTREIDTLIVGRAITGQSAFV